MSRRPSQSGALALRTALIWHDEVMDDVVLSRPRKITLGRTGKATFTVPEIGLPQGFAIMRPGNRGYLLTLGERMRGTICVDGEQRSVEDFVRRGDGEDIGGFRATSISGRDWGVIDLDESGHYKLFFQFVPVHAPLNPDADVYSSLALAWGAAALVAWGLIAVSANWSWLHDQGWAEWLYRGAGVVYGLLIVIGLVWWLIKSDPEQQASTGFSVLLHGALLGWVIYTYSGEDPFVWPGPRSMTANYLITRLEPEPPPEPPKAVPTVGAVKQQEAAAASPTKPNLKTATRNDQGAAGGKGEQERARDPDAKDVPPEAPKEALLEDKNVKAIENVIERSLETNLSKFDGIKGDRRRGSLGFGDGIGTGVGTGTGTGTTRGGRGRGPGGGGMSDADFVSTKGPIDTGKDRPGGTCVGPNCRGAAPREVKLAIQGGTGDFGGYTEDEINRVVKARAGVFRACYQKELNRSPGIGGKLVIRFKIGADGAVQSAANAGGSSLSHDGVESCVKGNVMRLRFPPKGAIANVTYPFVFSQGG